MFLRRMTINNCVIVRLIALFTVSLFLVMMSSSINVRALTRNNIPAEQYSEETSEELLKEFNVQISKSVTANNSSIVNIDVSDKGYVCVALSDETIRIFDDKNNFIEQVKFESSGSYFVAWNDENLVLFFVRGNIAFEFTLEGENLAVYSYEPEESVYRKLEQTEIEVNNNIYRIINHSALTVTDSTGNETTIYEAENNLRLIKTLLPPLFGLVLFICFICYLIKSLLSNTNVSKTEQ